MTLPDVTVTITADGLTPARAAIAPCTWVRTPGVNEETSPASSRMNPTRLITGGEGGGEGEGGGGEGEGGGGEGEGGGGKGEGGGKFGPKTWALQITGVFEAGALDGPCSLTPLNTDVPALCPMKQ